MSLCQRGTRASATTMLTLLWLLCHVRDIAWHRSSQSLTHWGRVTHICVSKVTIIVSDNGLSPGRRQVIIWTNAGILFTGTLGINFSGINFSGNLIEIHTFSFKKMHLKMSSGKWRPFCLGLNVLEINNQFSRAVRMSATGRFLGSILGDSNCLLTAITTMTWQRGSQRDNIQSVYFTSERRR